MNRSASDGTSNGGAGCSGSGSGNGGSSGAGGSGTDQKSLPRQRPPFVDESIVWPSQEEVAKRLYEQTQVVLGDRNISTFRGVEFLVLTPCFVTLRQQTVNRLAKSELVRAGEEGSRVLMYTKSADNTRLFEEFKENVRRKTNTLFVMIADECHTSATIDGQHQKYVNDKDLRDRNNFVLLGVRCETQKRRSICVRYFSRSRSSHAYVYSATALPDPRWNQWNRDLTKASRRHEDVLPFFCSVGWSYHKCSHT